MITEVRDGEGVTAAQGLPSSPLEFTVTEQRGAQRAVTSERWRQREIAECTCTAFIFCPLPRPNSGTIPKTFPSQVPPSTGSSSLLAAQIQAGMLEGLGLEEEGGPGQEGVPKAGLCIGQTPLWGPVAQH